MKIETKGIFEALPNCMSLQEIIEYLDSRNYDERKAKEEYHEMYTIQNLKDLLYY